MGSTLSMAYHALSTNVGWPEPATIENDTCPYVKWAKNATCFDGGMRTRSDHTLGVLSRRYPLLLLWLRCLSLRAICQASITLRAAAFAPLDGRNMSEGRFRVKVRGEGAFGVNTSANSSTRSGTPAGLDKWGSVVIDLLLDIPSVFCDISIH